MTAIAATMHSRMARNGRNPMMDSTTISSTLG